MCFATDLALFRMYDSKLHAKGILRIGSILIQHHGPRRGVLRVN